MRNPLKELARFGQSPWYDNIRSSSITSGELERMIREDGLRGLTSNPTIFEKAREAFSRLRKVEIDLNSITAKLEEEGVKSFMDSFSSLLQCVRAKTEMIAARPSRKAARV